MTCLFAPRRSLLEIQQIDAPKPASKSFLAVAGVSKRPFIRPQRLPASGPPLKGQHSRPASSAPWQTIRSGPFGPPLPHSNRIRTRLQRDQCTSPVSRTLACQSRHSPASPPLWGSPLWITGFNRFTTGKPTSDCHPIALSSPLPHSLSSVRLRLNASGSLRPSRPAVP